MTKSVASHLAKCQTALKLQQYEPALDALKAAVQVAQDDKKADRINILDHRVAVHLGMENLELASKDSKAMIRHDRSDGRGYLRCGQIERLLGNQAGAIDWYKQGLKRVPATNRTFASLEKQLRKVEAQVKRELVFTKARDPMLILPLETVQFILSFLSYKETLTITRVSRPWNKLLCSLPPLTDTIDFRNPKRPINATMLRAVLRKLRTPKFVNVSHQISSDALQGLLGRLQRGHSFTALSQLELRLRQVGFVPLPFTKYDLKCLVIDFGVPENSQSPRTCINVVYQILKECPKLETLVLQSLEHGPPMEQSEMEVGQCTSLRTLRLKSLESGHPDITPSFLLNLPNLEELVCQGVTIMPSPQDRMAGLMVPDLRGLTKLHTLRLESDLLHKNMYLPPSLQDLKIGRGGLIRTYGPSSTELFTPLPLLQSLAIDASRDWPAYLSAAVLFPEAGGGNSVRSLSVTTDVTLEPTALAFLETGGFANLQHLTLRCQALGDGHAAMFAAQMPRLETLSLEWAMVTGVFVTDLLKAPDSRLRRVELHDCLKVSGDIVPWAERRGVEIIIKKTSASASLYRVRNN